MEKDRSFVWCMVAIVCLFAGMLFGDLWEMGIGGVVSGVIAILFGIQFVAYLAKGVSLSTQEELSAAVKFTTTESSKAA
jgi:hypothetical protein